jgi:acetyl esterase/lipase
MNRLRLAVFCLLFATSAQAQQRVSYGPYPVETGDIFTPPNAVAPDIAFVCVHGGGWVAGASTTEYTNCGGLAKLGAVTMAINYTLFNADNPTSYAPRAVDDVQLAIRYMRDRYPGIRVCVLGSSAGAHLALMAGAMDTLDLRPALDPLDQSALYPEISSKPDCVIAISAPTYMRTFIEGNTNAGGLAVPKMVVGLDGASPAHNLAWWSPALWVAPDYPPTVVFQGTKDTRVKEEQALMLMDRLRLSVIPRRYVVYQGGHAFNGLTSTKIQQYLSDTIAWVRARR